MNTINQKPTSINNILLYDSTFEGLLTAIFEVFEYRFENVEIISKLNYTQENFFAETHEVITDLAKSDRVLKKVEENLGKNGMGILLAVFLSEHKNLERLILSAVKHSINHPKQNILQDFAHQDILEISKIVRSVGRERHRMTAFVRFEKMQDETFFAKIEPDFNVLPLVRTFFKKRFADQKWMIFDLKRNYGIFYDLKEADFLYPEENFSLKNQKELLHNEELAYQKLWQRYYKKTNIESRKNDKLHIQHLPKRYWKYLTEKF